MEIGKHEKIEEPQKPVHDMTAHGEAVLDTGWIDANMHTFRKVPGYWEFDKHSYDRIRQLEIALDDALIDHKRVSDILFAREKELYRIGRQNMMMRTAIPLLIGIIAILFSAILSGG